MIGDGRWVTFLAEALEHPVSTMKAVSLKSSRAIEVLRVAFHKSLYSLTFGRALVGVGWVWIIESSFEKKFVRQ